MKAYSTGYLAKAISELQERVQGLERQRDVVPTPHVVEYHDLDMSVKAAMLLRLLLKQEGGKIELTSMTLLVVRWSIHNRISPTLREELRTRLRDEDFLNKELGWYFDGDTITV